MQIREPETRLKYLEDRLRLIETIPPAYDKVKYTLDPLAEYLAGLYLIRSNKSNEQSWREFLATVGTSLAEPKAIQGFLVAVRDCLAVKGREEKVPEFVGHEFSLQVRN